MTTMSKTPTKAEQARKLTGYQTKDAIEPLRSALLIAKWNARSYDDPNVTRVWIRKSDYPTLDAAVQALKDAGLPTGLDFTQYGRGNYGFADFSQILAEATERYEPTEAELQALTPAEVYGPSKAEIEAAVVNDPTTAGDSGSKEAPVASKTSKPKAEKATAEETPRQRTARMNAAAPEGQKWCPRHERYEDRSMFSSNRASKDGLFSICKLAEADDRKRWAAEKAAAKGKAPAALAETVAEVPASPAPKPNKRSRKTKAVVADGTTVQSKEDVAQAIADRLK
jgi:hypothetical protein